MSPYFAVFHNFFVNLDFSLGAVISTLLSGPLALPTEPVKIFPLGIPINIKKLGVEKLNATHQP
jgi:hypothetical protein